MYQDAGYGENWQPGGNNARRIDPYARSCAALAALFVIGFVLIVIVVLSLIPLYISRQSISTDTSSNTQVLKIAIINYNLQFQSPYDSFNPNNILSDTTNRQSLQAALTSMIQKDSMLSGSLIEINTLATNSTRRRRQTSDLLNITFDLYITTNKSCSSTICSIQTQLHTKSLLSNSNKILPTVRFQESNSASLYYVSYQLPPTLSYSTSMVYVDLKLLSSRLNALLLIDTIQQQPVVEDSTSMLVG